jgi:hypothetical protein
MASSLAIVQGVYFLVTGVWPLISIRTFMVVTGPKTDLWLVKTVGVLVAVIGGVLILAGVRDAISPEVIFLATGSALALTWVDVNYVVKRVIAPIYLVDAAAEIVIIAAWGVSVALGDFNISGSTRLS